MKKLLKEPSLWLLIFLVGFPQVSETIYTPSLPQLATMLQATGNQVQQTLSIYFLGFALGVILWGIMSDKIGRRPSMLYGIVMYIVGSIGCLMATTVELMLLWRLIQAAGAAAGSVVTQTIMRDCYDDSRRPQVFARVSAVLAFSPAIGPLLGSQVANAWGVRAVFVALVFIGLVAYILSHFMLGETRPNTNTAQPKISAVGKRMIADKHICIFGGFIGIINGIIFCYYGEAPFIFIEHFGFSVAQYGYLGVIIALASFVGAIVGKWLIKQYYYIKVMQIGYGMMLLAIGIFITSLLLETNNICTLLSILVSIFVLMVGIGIALPSCLSNALIHYKDCLGVAGALLGLYYYIIVSLSTFAMSILHSQSLLVLPIFVGILISILIALTRLLKTPKAS